MNICNLEKTFGLKKERGWKTIYVLLDVHGTIIESSYHSGDNLQFIVPEIEDVLKWMSKREDFKIIIWTSSYPVEISRICNWLKEKRIQVDSVNSNPFERDTDYASFKSKPYFNILIDDKSGFDPNIDWLLIGRELEVLTGDTVISWNPVLYERLNYGISDIKTKLNFFTFPGGIDY